MPLDESVIASVANANFKTLADQVGSNVASHQQRLQILAEKALATSLQAMDTTSVPEGLGIQTAKGSELGSLISQLAAAVASISGSVKGAGNIPPVTP